MNCLYQGDNLAILRNMPDASVDLICTDPPFNTGKDWGAFSDKWEGGLKGYLKFMEPRLVECIRVLKDTGSLYLHCDPAASHYLKVILDSIFGIKNFKNEIIWTYRRMQAYGRSFQNTHNTIFRYVITNKYVWNQLYEPLSKSTIKRWGLTERKIEKNEKGEIVNCGKSDKISKGTFLRDVWDLSKINSSAKERLGYPTQKPVALYERMIKASSNQGDVVLDPFAGSGTTLDAAESLGRAWIGIDVGDAAINVIQGRLRDRHGLEYDRDYQLIT